MGVYRSKWTDLHMEIVDTYQDPDGRVSHLMRVWSPGRPEDWWHSFTSAYGLSEGWEKE